MMTFEEILDRDGKLVYKTKGVSMLPMLHQNRDLVVIQKPVGRLLPYDVALYRRGADYVLHRVVRVRQRDYLIRGDNTYLLETVPDEAVIGVLTGFTRNGRQYEAHDKAYRFYVRLWCAVYPLRAAFVLIRRRTGRLLKKAGFMRK